MNRNRIGWIGLFALLGTAACGAETETRSFAAHEDWQGWLTAGLDPEQSLLVSGATGLGCQQQLKQQCTLQQGDMSVPVRVAQIRSATAGGGFLCAAACVTELEPQASPVLVSEQGISTSLRGWNIVQPSYRRFHLLDGFSLEWDYFMVHDKHGRFTGSVGYLLADPRGRLNGLGWLPGLVPSGMNAAIAGSFAGAEHVAEFKNFGLDQSEFSAEARSTRAQQGEAFARMVPTVGTGDEPDRLLLQGRTDRFEWDLQVSQDWSERGGFEATHGRDVGLLPGEHWNVEMLWPRTLVTGQITNLETGETVEIDGHGYRENSWGRWAFITGGWDFAIVSDEQSAVQWAWQTYHFTSEQLDFVDVSFLEEGAPVKIRFNQDQIGWTHSEWSYDAEARQCVPLNGRVVAANEDYRVEVDISIYDDQVAMLSNITPVTQLYVIMIQFPFLEGRLENLRTGATTHFAGRGGGEFSLMRDLWPKDEAMCNALFTEVFGAPMPESRP